MADTHMINGLIVTSPDTERWEPAVVGIDLNAQQKRNAYYRLTWSKRVVPTCDISDWMVYDNTRLLSLYTLMYGNPTQWALYDDVVCQSVTATYEYGVVTGYTATFLVRVIP